MKNPLPSDAQNMLRVVLDAANQKDQRVLRWIRRIDRYGVTESLGRDLNAALEKYRFDAYFGFDAISKSFVPRFGKPEGMTNAGDDFILAFQIASLISEGKLDRLRRCERRGCLKYHVRSAQARWCSDGCGSGKRQRDKRTRDKAGGMNEHEVKL